MYVRISQKSDYLITQTHLGFLGHRCRSSYADKSILISYEDSSLRFIPRSQREKNRKLYPAPKGRMAGAYFINRIAAQSVIDRLRKKRQIWQ